jgi:hypothetical protein
VEVGKSLGRSVAVDSPAHCAVEAVSAVTRKTKGSAEVAAAVAGNVKGASKAETDAKSEEIRRTVDEGKAEGMGIGESALVGVSKIEPEIVGANNIQQSAVNNIKAMGR